MTMGVCYRDKSEAELPWQRQHTGARIQHVQKLRAPEHLSLLRQISPPRTHFSDGDEPNIHNRDVPME